MMKRMLVMGLSLIAIYLGLGSVALAGYPHGDFATNPDGCPSCHRIHTATSGNLMKDPSGSEMCKTCHNGGIGADTDVMNGKYVAGGESSHVWGDPNMNLLGGGFNYIQNTGTTTSRHVTDTPIVPFGADPNTPPGAYVTLKCVSCHSPHMNQVHQNQYRLLRLRPNGGSSDKIVLWNGPWSDDSQTAHQDGGYRAYTEKDFDSGQSDIQQYTNNYKSGLDTWCVSCHTRYTTREDTTPYDAGDTFGSVKRFRHHTDSIIVGVNNPVNGLDYNLTTDLPLNDVTGNGRTNDDKLMCLTCHNAHGTNAVMSTQAAMDPTERGILPVGSTLLKRSQRGVCTNCHANI